ncbi:MAG: hypothetical protein CRN43_20975 [Candidatus Nephrothrix sp. EaCA]|nr:MAG: hypothetical protein CRN43_20975 [Candidatus Nephrothrix sp. EaCA]
MKQTWAYSITLLTALIGLALSVSCGDDTFKKARPESAGISSDRKKENTEVIDTLKNYFKGAFKNKSYSFTIVPKGKGESATAYLIYSLAGGTGALTADGKDVKDTVKAVADTPINLVFTPSQSTGEGEYVLSFVSYNQFGLSSSEKTALRLRVIKNLSPVAKFKITLADPKTLRYEFDASASFDPDAKFSDSPGTRMAAYEYTIYQNERRFSRYFAYKSISPINLPSGSYTVTLRVVDDEGSSSDPVFYSDPKERPFIVP